EPTVHGILVQLPLPRHIAPEPVLAAIPPDKDVDGFHAVNVGRLWQGRPRFVPRTPGGGVRPFAASGGAPRGGGGGGLGRAGLVGKPMAALLLAADATVTLCHSRTRDLAAVVGRADLLVAAIGKPAFVRGDWIKPGAVVIDVGINRGPDGKLIGDVEFEAAR